MSTLLRNEWLFVISGVFFLKDSMQLLDRGHDRGYKSVFLVLILPHFFLIFGGGYMPKYTFSSQSIKPKVKFHSFRISTLAVHWDV